MGCSRGMLPSIVSEVVQNRSKYPHQQWKGGHSRRDVLGGVAALWAFAPGLSACGAMSLTWTYRYRLMAEIESAGRIYNGSSVIEVVRERGYTGIGAQVRGEAAYIDIPGATSPLFLLMYNRTWGVDWPYVVPHYAFRRELGSTAMVDPKILDKLVGMNGIKEDISEDVYPLIVTFDNSNDPRTVREVNPSDLGRSYHANCRLRRISMELTADPLEFKVRSRLSWLKPGADGSLDATSSDGPLGAPLPLSKIIGPRQFLKS